MMAPAGVELEMLFFFFFFKKQDEHKSNLNEDIFIKHKLKSMYMYLCKVSGRGHRTQEP